MKGVILAGGLGSRLFPLTKITNKHLLPVYNEPMIYHPLRTLVEAGIRDILLVTGGHNAGDFLRLLGNGEAFGLRPRESSHLDHRSSSFELCVSNGGRRHRRCPPPGRAIRGRFSDLCDSRR